MDLFNLESNERLDRGDLSFALNLVPAGLLNELTGNFLAASGTNTIISGFRPSGTGQNPVQIGDVGVPNTALLGQRVNGAITQGVFSAVGPATQSLSAANLPANTYGIFVRFRRVPGKTETRKFVSKAQPGTEYAQLSDTRLVASWEARLEVSAPSAEWLKIGEAIVTAAGSGQGNTITVNDLRSLYFEGAAAVGFTPAWGSAADRSRDRSAANTGNLQRQLDALRQCIADVKGRNIASWYQPNISGMMVGSGFGINDSPTANRIFIGDYNFYLDLTPPSGGNLGVPYIALNGPNDYLTLNRYTSALSRYVSGTSVLTLVGNGGAIFGPGPSSGSALVTVNQQSNGLGHGLAVQTTSSVYASLGLISTTAKTSYIEFGNKFNSLYGALQCDWSSNITVTLSANSRSVLIGDLSTSSQLTTSLNGQFINFGNTSSRIKVGGRDMAPGGVVWSAGTYSSSDNTIIASSNSTVSASVRLEGTTVVIVYSNSLPANSVITVTPISNTGGSNASGRALSASYVISGTQLRIQFRNDNKELAVCDFSWAVLYGA